MLSWEEWLHVHAHDYDIIMADCKKEIAGRNLVTEYAITYKLHYSLSKTAKQKDWYCSQYMIAIVVLKPS